MEQVILAELTLTGELFGVHAEAQLGTLKDSNAFEKRLNQSKAKKNNERSNWTHTFIHFSMQWLMANHKTGLTRHLGR